MDPITFASGLLDLATQLGGSITSWRRTEKRNALVGGVKNSPHLKSVGADIVWDTPVEYQKVRVAAAFFDLRVIREKDHDHIQPLDWVS